jgi:hypothetical protein
MQFDWNALSVLQRPMPWPYFLEGRWPGSFVRHLAPPTPSERAVRMSTSRKVIQRGRAGDDRLPQ